MWPHNSPRKLAMANYEEVKNMPKGYYTGYSYCGIMPDGRKAYFVSDSEYLKEYEEEAKESRPSLFRI